jgi:hypothetical protein
MSSFAVSGSRIILAELLLDLAARLPTSIIVVDSARVFDPLRFKRRGGNVSKLTITRPNSASNLRTLMEYRLETMLKKTHATTVIVASTYGMFCKIPDHDLPYVCEYVLDLLFDLCAKYELRLIVGCDGHGFADQKFVSMSEFSVNLDELKRNQTSAL